jgi:uncharacterized membrane protein HdeD (DUF308 family)
MYESSADCVPVSLLIRIAKSFSYYSFTRSSIMTTMDLVKPWRLLMAIPALLYGVLLILGLPYSTNWLLLACGIILFVVMIASRLELPLLAVWPAFVGLFLLCACIFALIEDVVDYAFVPFTDSDSEIVLAILVAVAFIIWSVQTTRKVMGFESGEADS